MAVDPYEFLATNWGLVDRHLIASARLEVVDDGIKIPFLNPDGDEFSWKVRLFEPKGHQKYDAPTGPKPTLYAAPGAWDARRVGLTEGEFDALVATQAGLSSFANLGSHELKPRAIEVLRTKDEVVIIPDNDDASHRWLKTVIRDLAGYTLLRVVEAPET